MAIKCGGWRTTYCPSDAYVRLTYAYRGASAWPETRVFCVDCFEHVLEFFRPLLRNKQMSRWQRVWLPELKTEEGIANEPGR